jgi:type I restriction enzyme, S subunit
MEIRKIIIGDVCELNNETIGKSNAPQIIHYLDTGNITKNIINKIHKLDCRSSPFPSRAQRKVKDGTIIYSTVRPDQEHYGIIDNPISNLIVSTGFLTLDVIDKEINPRFLYYALTQREITQYLHTIAVNNVSSYPSLNPSDIGSLGLDVPKEMDDQKKIASVLSSLDSKIELNNRINLELDVMAKTLYDYWFVQFDFPNKKGKPYKTSGGKMVWNEELKREIPEGWEFRPLNNIVTLILDHRGKTPLKLGGDWVTKGKGIIALSAKHVKGGKLVKLDEANVVSFNMYKKWMSEKLMEGDILMTSEAPLGEFYFILNDTNYCLSQRLFAIRADQSQVFPTYLYFELSKGNGLSQIIGKQSGSTVFGIRQDELRKVKVLKPTFELQKKFDEKTRPMLLQIRNNEFQNQKLTEIRDWLLPMLMNGQVKVI